MSYLSRDISRWSSDPWRRGFFALSLLISGLCIIFILDYTVYPHPAFRYWLLEYFLRTQDIAGSLLLVTLLVAALFAPTRGAALAFVDTIARHPWWTAGATFVVLCLGSLLVQHNHPVAQDEYAALFQSRIFAAGNLTGLFPREVLGRLVAPQYLNHFIYGSFQTGQVASAYWPGFALLLTPFSFLHAPWACNPLLASLALVLMGKMAARLTGVPQASGWAMLLALGSPGFTAMTVTYFSQTSHLLFNLAFAWLLFTPTTRRLVLAGLVGSFALVLHNPLPHTLFALPWIVWLTLQPGGYRKLLALAAGYVPLVLVLGFGWALLLSHVQGNAYYGIFPFDDNPFHRVANFFWGWHIKMRSALAGPGDEVLAKRAAEFVRLWTWAVPGLPLLAAAGWWLGRGDRRVLLLGLSIICTILGYFFIGFSQGYGWGARYFHPAWGSLPVLGAVALVLLQESGVPVRVRGYVADLALLSLVLATSLRAMQIDDYVDMHLANRPPTRSGVQQIVFIPYDRINYSADLIQNDPFLRNKVWFMASFGRVADRKLVESRFPNARLASDDRRGQTWLVE
jgi:hypothetical protein